jgi:hypothetical protein
MLAIRNRLAYLLRVAASDDQPTNQTTNMSITIINNSFTGYKATIRAAADYPSVSTIKKHLRKAKGKDCLSVTTIYCDGEGMDLVDMGRGLELVSNGQYAKNY